MIQTKRKHLPIAGIEYTGGEVVFSPADHKWPHDTSTGEYGFDTSKCDLSESLKKMIATKYAEEYLLPLTVHVSEWQVEFDGVTLRVTPEVWSWT